MRSKRAHGGDIDDATLPLFYHASSKDLATLEGAGAVETEHLVDGLGVQIKEAFFSRCCGGGRIASSGVDEDIHLAESTQDVLLALLKGGAAHDVTGDGQGCASLALDCRCYRLGRFSITAKNGDVCPSLREGVSHGSSEMTAAAGDNGCLASYFEEHV